MKTIKLKYFTAVYCPWCHGFGNELRQFLEAHPEIELELISGGFLSNSSH